MNTTVTVFGIPAEIRTQYFPNTSTDGYRQTRLIGFTSKDNISFTSCPKTKHFYVVILRLLYIFPAEYATDKGTPHSTVPLEDTKATHLLDKLTTLHGIRKILLPSSQHRSFSQARLVQKISSPLYFYNIYFNIILQSHLRLDLEALLFPVTSPQKVCMHVSILSVTCPIRIVLIVLIILTLTGTGCK